MNTASEQTADGHAELRTDRGDVPMRHAGKDGFLESTILPSDDAWLVSSTVASAVSRPVISFAVSLL